MKSKEIQDKLNISSDRIKYFRREGIFSPENISQGNKPIYYTENDLQKLSILVVLTKSGLTCSDIKKIQNNELSLKDAISARKKLITDEIERKRNSLALLTTIYNDDMEYDTFNTEYYLNIIAEKEKVGEEFMHVEDLYSYNSISLIRNIHCPYCNHKNEIDLEDYLFDESCYEKENGMGPDIVYSFNTEKNFMCTNCDNVIEIEGWIREYPIGAYDSEKIIIKMKE